MSQAVLSQGFRNALDLVRSGVSEKLAENPLLDVIQTFADEKRVLRFYEDIEINLNESGNTLIDAEKLNQASEQIDILIKKFSDLKKQIGSQSEDIIKEYVKRGILSEEGLLIEPKTGNRSVNSELVKSQEKKWKNFIEMKKADLETTIKLTQDDLKSMFGSSHFEEYLLPGKVTGYKLVASTPTVEKGSIEVEP